MLKTLQQTYPDLIIKENEPLSYYTYTKTGGKADIIVFPKTKVEVQQVIEYAKEHQIPLTVIGNASNLIVRDGGIRGIVMILTEMKEITLEGTKLVAQSGAKLIDVSRLAGASSLMGLEFACGIPGSVGGAVYMNAGAYGGEVKDVITQVEIITRTGEFKVLTNEECDFSYRHSLFQSNDDIVLSVTFELEHGILDRIRDKMTDLTFQRESKQPLEYPSCGSVFKRPEGHFTGKLIQDAGLQGYRIGGAEVSKKHAGFIVNIDGATATDYIELIRFIQDTIWELNQVRLEPEVKIIGEDV